MHEPRMTTIGLVSLILSTQALANALSEIRYHAIVEAPPARVWTAIAGPRNVSKWLCRRAEQWVPAPGRPYRITLTGGAQVEGRIVKADRLRLLQLSWPTPASTLTLEVKPLDDHLTMVTLVHDGWPNAGDATWEQREALPDRARSRASTEPRASARAAPRPESSARAAPRPRARQPFAHADFEHRWRAALMKLHRLFPPPLVDTKMHRPRSAKGLFIERNLIVNGDFEFAEPGKYKGVAFGWETNSAKSSPHAHVLDGEVHHTRGRRTRGRSQCIKHPPDWTNFAVQQFTSHLEPMIQPGKRYRLTAWVKADGIRNPAGWYKIGLWCTDAAGRPIGEPLKNARLTDAKGNVILDHDWTRITIEGTAPPGAARAVVILTGHWDDAGTVWYDDINLWPTEKPPTTRR